MINVIKGPAALSYIAANGHRYWIGYASGNRPCAIARRTPERALKDARQKESKNDYVPRIYG